MTTHPFSQESLGHNETQSPPIFLRTHPANRRNTCAERNKVRKDFADMRLQIPPTERMTSRAMAATCVVFT